MMNNPNNPYSTNWANNMLDKRYNMKLGTNGFLNGVPVITLNKKKNKFPELSKKELKDKLSKMKMKEIEDDVPEEVREQFNTNRKNFYQFRKDIAEESAEKESEDFDNDENKENKDEIQFPLIYKYFNHTPGQ